MVKETLNFYYLNVLCVQVSIPSRGSGKGDFQKVQCPNNNFKFQSPLGEVVKETLTPGANITRTSKVSIPSRGSGKGDEPGIGIDTEGPVVSIPSRGSGKGDKISGSGT